MSVVVVPAIGATSNTFFIKYPTISDYFNWVSVDETKRFDP